jgi:hypothetical protein
MDKIVKIHALTVSASECKTEWHPAPHQSTAPHSHLSKTHRGFYLGWNLPINRIAKRKTFINYFRSLCHESFLENSMHQRAWEPTISSTSAFSNHRTPSTSTVRPQTTLQC